MTAEGMGSPPGGLQSWIDKHPLGASWGNETDRADVLAFDPDGKNAWRLRHRHPQLRRPRRSSRDRRPVLLDQ